MLVINYKIRKERKMEFIINPQNPGVEPDFCSQYTGGCYYDSWCPGNLCSPDCGNFSLPCFFTASVDDTE